MTFLQVMNLVTAVFLILGFFQWVGWSREHNNLKQSCAPSNPYVIEAERARRNWGLIFLASLFYLIMANVVHT